MTLKQSQSHQTYNENVHPEQGYNHAKFENLNLKVSKIKAIKKNQNNEICQLSPLNMFANQK